MLAFPLALLDYGAWSQVAAAPFSDGDHALFPGFLLPAFWLAEVVLFAYLAMVAAVAVTQAKRWSPSPLLVTSTKRLTWLMSTVLYIPLSRLLLHVLKCTNTDSYSVIDGKVFKEPDSWVGGGQNCWSGAHIGTALVTVLLLVVFNALLGFLQGASP